VPIHAPLDRAVAGDRERPAGWRCAHLGDGGQCDRRHSDKFFEDYLLD
jgi:hypothetical protein